MTDALPRLYNLVGTMVHGEYHGNIMINVLHSLKNLQYPIIGRIILELCMSILMTNQYSIYFQQYVI